MHIPYHILIGDQLNSSQYEKVQKIIKNTFYHIDHVYNNWNPSSEISSLSKLKAFEKMKVSPELYCLLKKVDELYQKSEGKFDVTMEPLCKLWKQSKPNPEELARVVSKIGWNKIHFLDEEIWKECSETNFDLGGIAKGYAVDLLIENLQKEGFKNIFVEWGGEISARGHHPSGRAWKVGIKHANKVIDLNDQAIATSGGDYQFWTIDGVDYIHIINPITHAPLLKTCINTTVIASNCLLSDALATIAMQFEKKEDAEKWMASHYPDAQLIYN